MDPPESFLKYVTEYAVNMSYKHSMRIFNVVYHLGTRIGSFRRLNNLKKKFFFFEFLKQLKTDCREKKSTFLNMKAIFFLFIKKICMYLCVFLNRCLNFSETLFV